MQVTFESRGDFEKLKAWLDSVSKNSPDLALDQIAREGQRSLSSNTPRDTGKTAGGWTYKITSRKGKSEISWMNKANPGLTVNLAKLIDQGHGTGTGGYVRPQPYIERSMDSIWQTAGDKIAKELIK